MTVDPMIITAETPKDVGILGMEIYFPKYYVNQSELELYDGVSPGKYTIGLGQDKMSFCMEDEDVYSMALTVVQRLMKSYNVSPESIGCLEVGTESNLDRAKSVKTYLMQLFSSSGNDEIVGVDSVNACFGGTAALMHAISWMTSSLWDGRLAIVVASDVAVYEKGPARPTGGAGAVAMLIGPKAPLVLEYGIQATYMGHTFDFYKPNPFSAYPIVDGKHSIESYFTAFNACCRRIQKRHEDLTQQHIPITKLFDHLVFHSPYTKLVQKVYLRLAEEESESLVSSPEKAFATQTVPSTLVSKQLGNLYCASVFTNLISLICNTEDLLGKRIGVFSYGSGVASMLFSLQVKGDVSPLVRVLDITDRLAKRVQIFPDVYEKLMKRREQVYGKSDWTPQPSHIEHRESGVYVLNRVDELYRRYYTCTDSC